MTWSRMSFRGEPVWVRVDEQGRPALDADGRAEMKYREHDTRVYHPNPVNLVPAAGGGDGDETAPDEAAARPAPRRPPRSAPAGAPIEVWTDGACSGNPGPMGIGVVVIADGTRREHGEFLGSGTNNIAELTAIERGLALAAEIDPTGQRPVRLYSDSGYALGLLGKGWKAKANRDLVQRLRRLADRFDHLSYVKVEGHAGVEENERCDALARQAIEEGATGARRRRRP